MLEVRVLCAGRLLPPTRIGGGAIYRYTPLPPEIAWERQPKNTMWLPGVLRAIAPPAALPAPSEDDPDYDDDGED